MAKNTVKKSSTKKKSVAKKKAPVGDAIKRPATKKKTVKKTGKSSAPAEKDSGYNFTLSSVLAINDAKMLYTELNAALEKKEALLIDASAVEMVDTAILQLLLAFIKKARLQGMAVTWVKPSKEFISRSKTLGLTSTLGLHESGA